MPLDAFSNPFFFGRLWRGMARGLAAAILTVLMAIGCSLSGPESKPYPDATLTALRETGCFPQESSVWPVREALFSVRPQTDVEGFDDLASLWGLGWIGPLETLDGADAGPAGFHGAVPVNRHTWTDGGFRFVPRSDGQAILSLGPAPPSEAFGQRFHGALVVNTLSVNGSLVNGALEPQAEPEPRVGGCVRINRAAKETGNVVPESSSLEHRIALEAGHPVTVRFSVRAMPPPGYRDMARLPSSGTPAHKAVQYFQRGINLGNHLEAPPDEDWGPRYSATDFDAIKAEGFDHVRLPVAWQHYMTPDPDDTLDEMIFTRVDRLVRMAAERDLAVILNWHHFDAFTSDPARHIEAFDRGWARIAQRYAAFPGRIAFELLNEPRDAADTFTMNAVYERVIATVRAVAPNAPIFVGPGRWNHAAELSWLRLPAQDANIIVTVHHYEPFLFTHQGAHWTQPLTAATGIRFPGPAEARPYPVTAESEDWTVRWFNAYNTLPEPLNPCGANALAINLRLAKAWSEYAGRPVHVGEWGCIALVDPKSRARYHRAMRRQLDHFDLPWALWDWKAHFRYWDPDRQQPMPGLREALFPTAPSH